MIKSQLTVSTLALSVALFMAVPLKTNAKEKVVIDLKPKSGWAATMIEGPSPADSYCALTRQYDHGVVFTLGQNTRDEYSLAFDFQDEKLNTEKAYKINLQPAPGQLRAYEMMPASPQALVVRLGYDESFLQAIEKSNQLKAEIDGKHYQFVMDDLDGGQGQLKNCMAGLTGKEVIKTAKDFSAEKIDDAEPLKGGIQSVKKVADVVKDIPAGAPKVVKAPVIVKAEEVAVEGIKMDKPQDSKKEIKISRIDSQKIVPVTPNAEIKVKAEPKMLAVETPKVEEAEVAIKTPEPIILKAGPQAKKITEADIPKMVDKKLASNTRVSVDPDLNLSARPKSMAVENKSYGSKVAPPKPVEVKTAMVEPKAAPKVEIVEEAPAEIYMPAKEAREKIKTKEIKIEKTKAKIEAPIKEAAPRSPDPETVKKMAEVKVHSVETDKELEKVREQLKELEKENHQLYQDARKARGQIDTAIVETSNEALKQMRVYERKLEAARADNLALSKEIEEMRRIQEDASVSALAGDPAAQQSLKRYNEAEREIKRLGLLLEQQRLAHREEKTELEEMLFDPAVADQAQRKKLLDLEEKLAVAEKRLQLESQKVNRVDPQVQKKLQDMEIQLAASKKKEDQLKAQQQTLKIKQQEVELLQAQKIAAAEAKLAALTQKEQAIKLKEQRLLTEEKKLSNADAKLAQVSQKEQQLKVTEEKLRMEAQKVAGTEARLAHVSQKEQQLRVTEEKMRMEAQKIADAEVRLAQARKKEQELLVIEQALRAKTSQAMASADAQVAAANAKLAAMSKKEQEIKAVERRITEQSKKIASYSQEGGAPKGRKVVVAKAPVVPSFGQGNIQQLLNKSGLSSISSVTQQSAGHYSWNAAGMTGKAHISSARQNLSQFVQSYIAKEKQDCNGDFASLPATVPNGKQGFEIACVGPNGGRSKSVVFAQKNGNLIAIVHETTADNMDAAIDARDKVAAQL